MTVRTQIYLETEQHRRLKAEARSRNISLAAVIRELVDEALGRRERGGDLTPLIGLGSSTGGNVSRQKDEWLEQALRASTRT